MRCLIGSCLVLAAALMGNLPSPSDLEIRDAVAMAGPLEVGQAKNIRGIGTNGNDFVGPVLLFEGKDADGLVISGKGAKYIGTGGSVSNLRICKKSGHHGGRGLVLTALNEAERSGEYVLRDLKVFPESALGGGAAGYFADGVVVSGEMLTKPGAAGIRRVMMDNVRVASCTNRAFFLHNAVHCTMNAVQVDPGRQTQALFEIRDGQNIQGVNMIIHGDLILTGKATEVSLTGRFHTLRVGKDCRAVVLMGTTHNLFVEDGATGAFHGYVMDKTENKSKLFAVR